MKIIVWIIIHFFLLSFASMIMTALHLKNNELFCGLVPISFLSKIWGNYYNFIFLVSEILLYEKSQLSLANGRNCVVCEVLWEISQLYNAVNAPSNKDKLILKKGFNFTKQSKANSNLSQNHCWKFRIKCFSNLLNWI